MASSCFTLTATMHSLMPTSPPSLLCGATPATGNAFHLQLLSHFQLLCGQRALIKIYKIDPKSPAVHQAACLPLLQYLPGPSHPVRDQASTQRCTSTLPQLTSFPPKNQPVSTGVEESQSVSTKPVRPGASTDPTVDTPYSSCCSGGEIVFGLQLLSEHSHTISVPQPTGSFLPSSPPCRD